MLEPGIRNVTINLMKECGHIDSVEVSFVDSPVDSERKFD